MKHFIAVAVGAVAVFGLLIGGVTAHSRPVRFDPAPGSVLNSAPTAVTGWFNSDLRREDDSFIRVLDAEGNRVDVGDTELDPERRRMSVALASGLSEGRYLVHWSTHDDGDGEVFDACHYFFVGPAAADATLAEDLALDGGAECPASQAGVDLDADHDEDSDHDDDGAANDADHDDSDSDGVPVWTLIVTSAFGVLGLMTGAYALLRRRS